MLEFSSTESCTTSTTSSPLVGFSSNTSSCDGNVALMNDFESTEGCSGQGPQGPEGFSAYQIAVFDGFVGTETQWLASLVGPVGPGVPVGGTAGQILAKINSTNYNTQWINNFALPTLTSGSVVFSNGTTLAQDNANFFFDNTNKRLGIGTNPALDTLDIKTVGQGYIRLGGADGRTISAYNSAGVATTINTSAIASTTLYTNSIYDINSNTQSIRLSTTILSFWTNSLQRLTILNSGNVGIGTATPISTLDVNGQVSIKNGLNFLKATTNIVGSYNADASNYQDLLIKANSYDFSIGAVNKLFISSAGNVGIGTTTPTQLLDILGVNKNAYISALVDTVGKYAGINIGLSGSYGGSLYYNTGTKQLRLGTTGGPGNDSAGILVFATGTNIERVRIDNIGNVGIGTTTPAQILDIYKIASAGVQIASNNAGDAILDLMELNTGTSFGVVGTSGFRWMMNGVDNKLYLKSGNEAAVNTRLTVDRDTGNVGIGTNTPLGILHLKTASGTTRLLLDGDAGQSKIITYRSAGLQRFGLYTNNTAESGSNVGSDFQIRAYNDAGTLLSTPLFIKRSSGNVGIGTTTPLDLLQVGASGISGTTRFGSLGVDITGHPSYGWVMGYKFRSSAGTLAGGLFANGNSGAVPTYYTIGSAYNVGLTVLQSNGNVGIGTTTPTASLHISGASATALLKISNPSSVDFIIKSDSTLTDYTGLYWGTDYKFLSKQSATLFINIGNNIVFANGLAAKTTMNSSGQLGVGVSNVGSILATLQVKGDGTNPIARFEDTAGANGFYISLGGNILPISSGSSVESITAGYNGGFALGGSVMLIKKGSGAFTDISSGYVNGFRFSAINNTSISGDYYLINLSQTFSASAGSANFRPLNIGYTINNTGIQTGTATGIFLNATETALNGMVHNLMDLQVGGVSKFSVINTGQVLIDRTFGIKFMLSSVISAPSNGNILLQNTAGTDFGRLQFGGGTNLFPSIKRNGSAIDFKLADDSGFSTISAGGGNFNGAISSSQGTGILSGVINAVSSVLSIVPAAGSANFRLFNTSYTINASGAQTGNTTGYFLNATETSLNGMTHNLMDLQVNSVSRFSVTNTGTVRAAGTIYALGELWPSNGNIRFSGAQGNGLLQISNSTGTDFGRIMLGGTTSSFPAIKRSGSAIDFRLADDSGYGIINSDTHVIYHSGDRAIEFVKTGANGYSIEHDVARIYFYNRTTAQVALRIINNGSVSVGNLDAVASALFQIDSTTKGFLPPRMTNAQRIAIATPAVGLIVYCTDVVEGVYVNKSTGWTFIA